MRMNKQRAIIAPSILSANFAELEKQIRLVEKGGADWIHLDIMDGHFVPNLTFGPMVVRAIRSLTKLPLDTHLMIEDPDASLSAFASAGANRLTVHVETSAHLYRTIQRIRDLGVAAGVTLKPATSPSSLKEILPLVDLVLVMTVNPGFGGQKFIASMLPKVKKISQMVSAANRQAYLEVDGGVDERTAPLLARAGANAFVAGHSIFSKKNIPRAIASLRRSVS